jgi:DNA polymerase-1
MLLQVHDELVFEVLQDELETVEEIVRYEMINAMPLGVPLEVEMGSGPSWLDAH